MILGQLTSEFVIMAKFVGHVLHHLASKLVYVIWQGGREGGKQTKNLVLAILKKKLYLSFYNCCTVLCTTSGLVTLKKVLFVT